MAFPRPVDPAWLHGTGLTQPSMFARDTTFIDECEENYVVSPHVGEIYAAAADTLMVALCCFGLRWATRTQLPLRWCFFALLFAALSSMAYHTIMSRALVVLDIVTVACAVMAAVDMVEAMPAEQDDGYEQPPAPLGSVMGVLLPCSAGFAEVIGMVHLGEVHPSLCEVLIIGPPVALALLRIPALWHRFGGASGEPARLARISLRWLACGVLCLVGDRWRWAPVVVLCRTLRLHALWHICVAHAAYFLCSAVAGCHARARAGRARVELRWACGFVPFYANTRKKQE